MSSGQTHGELGCLPFQGSDVIIGETEDMNENDGTSKKHLRGEWEEVQKQKKRAEEERAGEEQCKNSRIRGRPEWKEVKVDQEAKGQCMQGEQPGGERDREEDTQTEKA